MRLLIKFAEWYFEPPFRAALPLVKDMEDSNAVVILTLFAGVWNILVLLTIIGLIALVVMFA